MSKIFYDTNVDYPLRTSDLIVVECLINENDVPQGYGGINKEQYSYKELCYQPIIPELLDKIKNSYVRKLAEECNARNRESGFKMFKVNEEYCFWGLRLLPVVQTPALIELREFLGRDQQTLNALINKNVTSSMIRDITYKLLRQELAKVCGVNEKEAAHIIGNELDCAPHEDPCGYIFMVPNWAHNWFRHDGYVKQMLVLLNER